MTIGDLEVLFGGPPHARLEGGVVTWRGTAGIAFVLLDGKDMVIGAAFIPAQEAPGRPSRLDSIRNGEGQATGRPR
jgi:hypothetical protein